MSRAYPVQIEVTSPAHFDRIQLLLRMAFAIVLAWFGMTAGWLACVLYAMLPLVAAVAVSSLGGERYLVDFAPRLWRVLAWLLQLSAYMTLLVDRFPTGEDDTRVRAVIQFTGRPTIGSTLVRLVTSIPSGFVLSLLGIVSGVLWVIAAIYVLLGEAIPGAILGFQRGMLRWKARLIAYHASLVEDYPPFELDTDRGRGAFVASGAR